jgi:hypothetical protein
MHAWLVFYRYLNKFKYQWPQKLLHSIVVSQNFDIQLQYQLKRRPSESKVSSGHHGWMHGSCPRRTMQRSDNQQDNYCA